MRQPREARSGRARAASPRSSSCAYSRPRVGSWRSRRCSPMSPTRSESRRPAAGQIRTAAAVVAALRRARRRRGRDSRPAPRRCSRLASLLLVVGSLTSFVATVRVRAHCRAGLTGAASSILVAAGVAAAAAWSNDADRGRVVAWTLVGAPAAWVAAMPVIGVRRSDQLAARVRRAGRRGRWPPALLCAALRSRRARRSGAGLRDGPGRRQLCAAGRSARCSPTRRGAECSSTAGALFVESYGTSLAAVGLALGLGAAAYIPGTFVAQRVSPARSRPLLAAPGGSARRGRARVRHRSDGHGLVGDRLRRPLLPRPAPGRIWGAPSGSSSPPASMPRPCRSAPPRPRSAGSSAAGAGGAALSAGGYPAMAVVLCRALRRQRALLHTPGLGALTRPGRERPLARHALTRSGSGSRSPKARPEPATRSRTVDETSTSPCSARSFRPRATDDRDALEEIAPQLVLARVEAGAGRPAHRARERPSARTRSGSRAPGRRTWRRACRS